MDDRSVSSDYNSIYESRSEWLGSGGGGQPSPMVSFSLEESSPLVRSRSNTGTTNPSAVQQQPCIKLYRRINDSNRNFTRFQASLASIFMPFHINTALVRYPAFDVSNKKNTMFIWNEFLDEKIAEQLRLIKSVAKSNQGFFNFNWIEIKNFLFKLIRRNERNE